MPKYDLSGDLREESIDQGYRDSKNISVVFDRSPRQLRGPAMQTLTGQITNVEIIYKNSVVTSVPAGEKFDVKVYYSVTNSAGGTWTIAAAAIQTDGQNAHADTATFSGTSKSGWFYIQDGTSQNNYWTMPNTPITLRVSLWGFPTPSGLPAFRAAVPVSQW